MKSNFKRKNVALFIAMIMVFNFIVPTIANASQEKTIKNTELSINQDEVNIVKGKNMTLDFSIISGDNDEKIVWKSEDTSIADVKAGVVYGVKEGKTKVTLGTVDGKISEECIVNVVKEPEIPKVLEVSEKEEINLEYGKTYIIENNQNKEVVINNSAGYYIRYNLLYYDENNNIKENHRDIYGNITLLANEKAKIEPISSNGLKCYIPVEEKDFIKFSETDIPVFFDFEFKSKKIYEIKNIANENINIRNTSLYGERYDAVYYDENKYVSGYDSNRYGDFKIKAKNTHKVELYDSDITAWVPYELKDKIEVKEVKESALYYLNLEPKKIYEIKNKLDKDINLINSSVYYERYDEVCYDENKVVKGYSRDKYGDFRVRANQINKVELYNDSINVWMPYENRDQIEIKEVNESVFYYFDLQKDKKYKIYNDSKFNINIDHNAGGDKSYDIIRRDNNSGEVKDYFKELQQRVKLNVDENVHLNINGNDIKCWILTDYKDVVRVEETEEQVLYKKILDMDKGYEIKNYTGKSIVFKNDRSNYYNIVKYKEDGTFETAFSQYYDINLDNNEYCIIYPEKKNFPIYIPYSEYENNIQIIDLDINGEDIFDLVSKVKISLTKELSKVKGYQEDTKIKDDLSNYNISIFNESTSKIIGDFQIKNNYILFGKNQTRPYNNIKITLSHKNGSTIPYLINATLDQSSNASISPNIKEKGYLKLEQNNVDKIPTRLSVFNDKGINISNISKESSKYISTPYYLNGKYTAVILKAKGELWRVDRLSDLDEKGFIEGKDYIKHEFSIEDNIIEYLKLDSIPILDEERLSFFNRVNTSMLLDTSSLVSGGNIEVRLDYEFKDIYNTNNIKDKVINFDLSEGISLIENSVLLDGQKTKYSSDNDKLQVNVQNTKGTIKFYINLHEAKNLKIGSTASFRFNNNYIKESLGEENVNVDYIILNGPNNISNKFINVYGVAKPNSKISLYDGKVKVGETNSKANGSWLLNFNLNNPLNGSVHKIIAKMDEGSGSEQVSNLLEINYSESSIELQSINMYYKEHETNKVLDLTNAFLNGEKPIYYFYPGTPFTFKVKMSNSENIEKLYITSEKNNEEKRIKAVYDKESDTWIASGFFDPSNVNYVPGILNISYVPKLEHILDKTIPPMWNNATLNSINESGNEGIYELTLDNEHRTKVRVNIKIDKSTNLSRFKKLQEEDIKIRETEKEFVVTMGTSDEMKELGVTIIDDKYGTSIGDIRGELGQYQSVGEFAGELSNFINYDDLNNTEKIDTAHSFMQSATSFIGASTDSFTSMLLNETIDMAKTVYSKWEKLLDILSGELGEYGDSWREEKASKNGADPKDIIDPSGYIYEAVPSNRLQGVTATVYYKDGNGNSIQWDAEEYDQINPQITDSEGRYEWFVPEGLWQVKYEKDGYDTTYSDWLEVPPPHTEVNVGLLSKEKPKIESFDITNGFAEIVFNKYMDIETIDSNSVSIKDSNNKAINISVYPYQPEKSDTNKLVAKKFKININDSLNLNKEYTVNVKNTVKTYSGISPEKDIFSSDTYTSSPSEIYANEAYDIDYNKESIIEIKTDKIDNIEGFELVTVSNMKDIVEVNTENIKFSKDGKAKISVTGKLPGEADIRLKIKDTNVEKVIRINVNHSEIEKTNEKPIINAKNSEIYVGNSFDAMSGITANDKEDGNITSKIKIAENTVDTSKEGIYKVVYEVTDSNGSKTTKVIDVIVREKDGIKPEPVQKGWVYTNGKWYYYKDDGIKAIGWLKDGAKWYYLNDLGEMQVGWLKLGTKWYYLNLGGDMSIGWKQVGSKWYYLNNSGEMQVGWLKLGSKWYYLNSGGDMSIGWKQVGSKWYYLNNSGEMQVGWLKLGTKWYYLNSGGDMAIGWKQVGSKWYYLYNSGVMATNVTIDGWKIGSSGVAIKIK